MTQDIDGRSKPEPVPLGAAQDLVVGRAYPDNAPKPGPHYEFATGHEPVKIKSNENFTVEIKLSRIVRFEVLPPFAVLELLDADGHYHKFICSSRDAEKIGSEIARMVKEKLGEDAQKNPA